MRILAAGRIFLFSIFNFPRTWGCKDHAVWLGSEFTSSSGSDVWVVKVDESGWGSGEHVFVFLSFFAKLQ